MKSGDILYCHNPYYNTQGERLLTPDKFYKVIQCLWYRKHQYINHRFITMEADKDYYVEFINDDYKNYFCSIKEARKRKLKNLKL